MSWFESLVLGALQGITEFLPISSSGHLVVFEGLFAALGNRETSGSDQLFFNVMLHLGTLAAIMYYYRSAAGVVGRSALGLSMDSEVLPRPAIFRATVLTVLATIPAVLVALLFKEQIEQATAAPIVAGIGFFVTAIILSRTQGMREGGKSLERTNWVDALLIGSAQAIAILPGVSRSGMTIAVALALGFTRSWAVTFSLLMAIPAILGAGVLEVRDLDPSSLTTERTLMTIAAMAVSALVGYLAIVWLFRVVRANRLWYFSVYLVIMAVVVVVSTTIRGGADATLSRTSSVEASGRGVRMESPAAALRASRPVTLDRSLGRTPNSGISRAG